MNSLFVPLNNPGQSFDFYVLSSWKKNYFIKIDEFSLIIYLVMDLFCPHTHTVPLSSELTIFSPSGLKKWNYDLITIPKRKKGNRQNEGNCNKNCSHSHTRTNTHLNKQQRIASPFSCDKIFVFDPSVRSHSIIVPSTDAEHNTPPYMNHTIHKIQNTIQSLDGLT